MFCFQAQSAARGIRASGGMEGEGRGGEGEQLTMHGFSAWPVRQSLSSVAVVVRVSTPSGYAVLYTVPVLALPVAVSR
jgi:hypothetical protein